MPDWALYDPQLQQFHAEGVTPAEIARRVSLAPQTVRDRLIKLGLLTTRPKTKTSPTQEAATPEPRVSALAAVIHTDTDPVSVEEASTFVDTLPAIAEEVSTFVDSVPTVLEEPQTLQHYENMIEAGMRAVVKAGRALQRIRDLRLYRDTYATFEAYCQQRWNLSRPRAYQLIAAADVVEHLRQSVRILPTNEAQARELASLTPALQAEVWGEVVETAPERKITAKHVQATVKRLRDTTAASRRQQEKPPPDRARQAAEWQDRFSHQFRDFERLLERVTQAGGVLAWEVEGQRRFLQELRAHAKTLLEMVTHFEKVIIGEEAALQALASPGESPTP